MAIPPNRGNDDRTGQLGRRIYSALRSQIDTGSYKPGQALPSTRALAVEWGISRATVVAAYDQLVAEGFIEVSPGARARVSHGLASVADAAHDTAATALNPTLSKFGERVAALSFQAPAAQTRLVADFRYGDLAYADFPVLAWKQVIGNAILRNTQRLRYEDPRGVPELRGALQAYLWRSRGLRCEVDQIMVVNGSQQGLDLCARLLLDPGDRVLIENPCYHLARHVFAAAGAEVVAFPVDADGLRTDQLLPARVAYVTPSHQFPLGSVLSIGRRQELLAWAMANGGYVIEDDYDGEYRYDIHPVAPLQSMDRGARTIYIGTVSKTLSPTLRLGYLVLPPALVPAMAAVKRLADRHTPTLEQYALADLIEGGAYERHIRRMRRKNAGRRAALLDALRRHLPGRATPVGTEAGLHVVAWLDTVSFELEAKLAEKALDAGVGVYPIGPLYEPMAEGARPQCAGLVLGYSALSAAEIDKGVELLSHVVEALKQG